MNENDSTRDQVPNDGSAAEREPQPNSSTAGESAPTDQFHQSLRVEATVDPTQFVRHGTSITWYGQPCEQIKVINAGTSLESLAFVHRDYAIMAAEHCRQDDDFAEIFDAKILTELEDFHDQFLCVGLRENGRLIGFWDVPLIWAEGRRLITKKMLEGPEFQALLNAAELHAREHPAEKEPAPEDDEDQRKKRSRRKGRRQSGPDNQGTADGKPQSE